MRYYLSGPLSGYDHDNFPAFIAACEVLRAQGLTVVSPHEKTIEGTADWVTYLRADLALLLDCDAIILLEGWPTSKGARLELDVALGLGLAVYFYSTDARGLTRMSAP